MQTSDVLHSLLAHWAGVQASAIGLAFKERRWIFKQSWRISHIVTVNPSTQWHQFRDRGIVLTVNCSNENRRRATALDLQPIAKPSSSEYRIGQLPHYSFVPQLYENMQVSAYIVRQLLTWRSNIVLTMLNHKTTMRAIARYSRIMWWTNR